MKQLKVIMNDTLSLKQAQNGAYITANFVTPIEIPVGSQICLDKFNCTSKNISQNFTIVEQAFGVDVNKYDDSITTDEIVIPAGPYKTVQDYMDTINELVNKTAISAYCPNPVANDEWNANSFYNLQRQNSMSLVLTQKDLFSVWTVTIYGESPLSTVSSPFWIPTDNLLTDSNGLHYSNDLNAAKLTSGEAVMNGGGLSTTFDLDLSKSALLTEAWEFGFVSNDGAKLGGRIAQVNGNRNLFLIGDNGVGTEITDSETLFAEAYVTENSCRFMIVQQAGNFGLVYTPDSENDNAPITVIGLPNKAYAGKLGTWTFAESYTMELSTGANAVVGSIEYTPETGGSATGEGLPESTETMVDLSSTFSNELALVLGFSKTLYSLSPFQNALVSTITSQSIININQLRSAFELAIEIVDIPLKNYFAQTGSASRSFGRQNVICYFTPLPSVETEGLYSFANSTHQWLDIDNTRDVVIQSLSFRIYNPYNGASFISNSLGFNLLIKSADEKLIE
jgi:hypothetical protein